jgi:hypothetical protein
LISAAAIVLVVINSGSTLHRAIALVSAAALIGYVVTPVALGFEGSPIFFVFTLRYTFFGVMLALIMLPLARVVDGRMPWVIGAFAVVMLVTQLDPAIWPSELRDTRFDQPIRGSDAIVAALIGGLVLVVGFARLARRDRPLWRPSLAVLVAIALVLVGGWYGLVRFYLDGRYRDTEPLPIAYRWARSIHDERIGVVGDWLQYPFAGKDLSNYVQYIGVRGDHGSFRPAETCREWREEVNAGDYSYVLTAPNPAFLDDTPIEEKWTRTDPAVSLVLRDRGAILWRIGGKLDPDSCRDTS